MYSKSDPNSDPCSASADGMQVLYEYITYI